MLADTTVADLIARVAVGSVLVRSPHATELGELLTAHGAALTGVEPGLFQAAGLGAERIGDLALAGGLAVHELTPRRASLEEAYMELTREAVEYR